MSIVADDRFRPPWWLRGGHRQSILVGLPIRRNAIERRTLSMRASAREWLIDCGDGVVLQAWHSSPGPHGRSTTGKVAVLMHGWEGSADSLYLLSAAQSLFDAGYDVVRLNFRDHGATHHLNAELFHSCRLQEVIGAVRAIQAGMPHKALFLVGFSLGGNFALRVAAAADPAGIAVSGTFAVSPLLDPKRTLRNLEEGSPIYHSYFVLKWGRSLLKKQQAWPDRYQFRPVLRSRNLFKMTDQLVRQFTDYPDVDSYFAGYALTGDRLASLASPATILTARDDPIIPALDLDKLAYSGMLRVRLTDSGGHCGYLTDLTGPSWVDRILLEEFAHR
jgi:predicted alpha/beta-fold hydrolase